MSRTASPWCTGTALGESKNVHASGSLSPDCLSSLCWGSRDFVKVGEATAVPVVVEKEKKGESAARHHAWAGPRLGRALIKGQAALSKDWSLPYSTVGHQSCPCVSAGALPLQSPVSAVGLKQDCRCEAARAPAHLLSPYLGQPDLRRPARSPLQPIATLYSVSTCCCAEPAEGRDCQVWVAWSLLACTAGDLERLPLVSSNTATFKLLHFLR